MTDFSMTTPKPKISILIPTKDEQGNLRECIQSVSWSDDICVFDSFSTDRTEEIALSLGARVFRRDGPSGQGLFGGDEAAHKNWALKHIPFKHPWVLHIDADERVTESLLDSMTQAVARDSATVAYRIRRRDFWMGQWLEHAQASPYYLRLFRPEKFRYERLINPVSIADGPVEDLKGYLDHFPFSKGLFQWLEKHNAYSTLEARQLLANRERGIEFSVLSAFFEKDFNLRRFHQKELFYRLPARPLLKFALLYLFKGGFLDGRAGLAYSILQAFYEYMIVLKTREELGKDHPIGAKPESVGLGK